MNEETLFEQAVQLPAGERAAFLERECPDPVLRARVEALLAAYAADDFEIAATGAYTPSDTVPRVTTAYRPALETEGTIIAGRYKLLQRIGEGGMGAVYMAQQTEPVKRAVAVKVIKAGMDTKAVLARFEAERQALALMDHPNIARVLDAGTTESGRPFFVMELVKGVPITKFCDERKLTPRQRLELFVPVCQAIQHAHQKGVIHRDIKPSNVLVALYDDRPVPKVIDFGVAKAAGQTLTDKTLMTGFGAVVGTPEYMSPEQASMNNLDIDTRSDVYSLGVLLYELLTGSTPVDQKSLGKAALLEVLRIVREEEPPRPSAKLSTLDTLPSVAANRGTEPAKLSRLMKGELDWLVLKALEKDRTRRYETANGLAMDVQRYLAGEAVQAHPPSTTYRLRKFARRNRPQVIAASLVLLALVAGIVGTSWQAVRAERFAAAERKARLEATKRLRQVEENNELLSSLFTDIDYRGVRAGKEPLETAIARRLVEVAQRIEGESLGDPLAVAKLQNRLALSLLNLGRARDAIPQFEKARNALRADGGAEHPDYLACTNSLAAAHHELGAVAMAVSLWEEVLEVQKRNQGASSADALRTMGNLALGYQDLGQLDRALSMHQESLRLRQAKLGDDDPDTITNLNNLGTCLYFMNRKTDALAAFAETFRRRKAKLGDDHPDTLGVAINLAAVRRDLGQMDEALALLEEVVRTQKRKVGPDHPDTLSGMNNLAHAHYVAGRSSQAIPIWEETVTRRKAVLGADHPDRLSAMAWLALAYEKSNQPDKLILLCEEILQLKKIKYGPDHKESLEAMENLATACCRLGKVARGVDLFREFLDRHRARHEGGNEFARTLSNVGETLAKASRFVDAEMPFRESLAIRAKAQPDAWTTFHTQSLLGGALLGQKKYAEAEPLLLNGYEGMKAREKQIPPQGATRIPEALDRLIELYAATHKPDEVTKYRDLRAKYPAAKEGHHHPK